MKTTRLVLTAVLISALYVPVVGATPALADAPSNDNESDAVGIDILPFAHSIDTSDATAGGPAFCTRGATVFYRFEPPSDMRVQIDTLGSDYDTMLGVYTRTAQGRVNPLKCSDDRIWSQAGVRIRAEAGRTYFLVVGACCSDRSRGGALRLNVDEVVTAPLSVTLDFDGQARVDRQTGIVVVSGAVTCNKRSIIYAEGSLRQVRDQIFLARGWWYFDVVCYPGAPVEWSFEVDTGTSVVFGPGAASIRRWYLTGAAGWGDFAGDDEPVDYSVTLV
jgi:hypothetical protein